MKNVIIILLVLIFFNTALTQPHFDYYNTSRFARPISMGNSFIGVAEGVETTFYNSAGLVFMDNYGIAYSYGNGSQPLVAANPFDIGLTLPNIKNIGSFAFSAHFLNYNDLNISSSTYRLHYSRLIAKDMSIGASINYFYQKYEPSILSQDFSSDAFDMSISGLFRNENFIFSNDQDILKVGFQFNNIFSTKIEVPQYVIIRDEENILIQYIGFGISYKYIPPIQKYNGFVLLSILFSSDFVFNNSINYIEYKFDRMNYNFGLELKIVELLALRFGRENDKNLSDTEYTTPQFPVSRFGIGFELPLHKFIKFEKKISIIFDYALSEWQKQDEINSLIHQFSWFTGGSEKYSFSFQIRANI
jgi:hypothetical protein